jgi:hypothetical protein
MAVKKPEPAKQKKSKDLDVGKTRKADKIKGGGPGTQTEDELYIGRTARRR